MEIEDLTAGLLGFRLPLPFSLKALLKVVGFRLPFQLLLKGSMKVVVLRGLGFSAGLGVEAV